MLNKSSLKGQLHDIFYLQFFFINQLHLGPDSRPTAVSRSQHSAESIFEVEYLREYESVF
jgi:hypothetical protein